MDVYVEPFVHGALARRGGHDPGRGARSPGWPSAWTTRSCVSWTRASARRRGARRRRGAHGGARSSQLGETCVRADGADSAAVVVASQGHYDEQALESDPEGRRRSTWVSSHPAGGARAFVHYLDGCRRAGRGRRCAFPRGSISGRARRRRWRCRSSRRSSRRSLRPSRPRQPPGRRRSAVHLYEAARRSSAAAHGHRSRLSHGGRRSPPRGTPRKSGGTVYFFCCAHCRDALHEASRARYLAHDA